ncbi:MAG: aminotransferase class V-fold PLP-dependent enzyme [Armatimonadetes bacterium]|nr:aminotransferase class V-fold PLP-dependent enzyme [Armatimonadota bacterium]
MIALGNRSLFPSLRYPIYLNHAAISPPSQAVQQAVQVYMADFAARGTGAYVHWDQQRERLREKVARLIGARPEEIAWVQSTGTGLLFVALCVDWKPGDRVVLFQGEFPANITPWQRAAAMCSLELMWLHPSDRVLENLESALRRGARLVAVSAVQFQTGLRMPIEAMGALCRRFGAMLAIDGIQACGAVPFDVEGSGADFMACGSHKWLMGPMGAGFLYVRRERVPELRPWIAGWRSHEEPYRFLFEGAGHLRYDRPLRKEASFFELGTQADAGYAGLEAALDPLLELGVDAVYRHINRYLDELEPEMKRLGFRSARPTDPESRSGMLSMLPPDGVVLSELVSRLDAEGIAVSMPDGYLRFSPQWPNSLDEIPHLLEKLGKLNKR